MKIKVFMGFKGESWISYAWLAKKGKALNKYGLTDIEDDAGEFLTEDEAEQALADRSIVPILQDQASGEITCFTHKVVDSNEVANVESDELEGEEDNNEQDDESKTNI